MPVTVDFFADSCAELSKRLQEHDWSTAATLTEAMAAAWKEKRQIFLCGNGGSGASALHWANDLLYPVSKKIGSGLRVQSLVDNPAVLTCLGNDEGYERIFSAQLEVKAEPGDLLIVFSGSGNSPNIVQALESARKRGMRSFAVLGFSGGRCLALADVAIHFKVDDMQMAEDFQSLLGHMVMRALKRLEP